MHSTNIPSLFCKREPEQTGSSEQERDIWTGPRVLSFLLGSLKTNTELNLHKSNFESSINEFLCTGLQPVVFFFFPPSAWQEKRSEKLSRISRYPKERMCRRHSEPGKRMEARMAQSQPDYIKSYSIFQPRAQSHKLCLLAGARFCDEIGFLHIMKTLIQSYGFPCMTNC